MSKRMSICINKSRSAFLSFDSAKLRICFQLIIMIFPMFRLLFSPLPLLFSFLFRFLVFRLIQSTDQLINDVFSPKDFLGIFGVDKLPIGERAYHLIIKGAERRSTRHMLHTKFFEIVNELLGRAKTAQPFYRTIVDGHH